MNNWLILILILFVLGIVVSNILLLKHSAKMPLKSDKKKQNPIDISKKP